MKDNAKNDKTHNVFVNESNKRCKIESVQKTFFQIINEIITIHLFTAMAGNNKYRKFYKRSRPLLVAALK